MDSTISSSAPLVPYVLRLVDALSDAVGASVPAFVNLELLRQMPLGSLGRAWAELLDAAQLQPLTGGPRRKQLHDGVHLLTGYGTDPIGEAEVQAFLLGAKLHPAQVALGLGTLGLIHRKVARFPLRQPEIRDRLWAAYQRGQRSRFDADQWQPETQWHLPLAEVRAGFGLELASSHSSYTDSRYSATTNYES
jgi:ubiquinone biosynthesis protein COQ4